MTKPISSIHISDGARAEVAAILSASHLLCERLSMLERSLPDKENLHPTKAAICGVRSRVQAATKPLLKLLR